MKYDLTGKKFNRLLVLSEAPKRNYDKGSFWKCLCDCGNVVEVKGYSLKSGHTKSCRCLQRELAREMDIKRNTTHNLSHNPIYAHWVKMKERCYDKRHKKYKDYGGRGIKICNEWLDLENFVEWGMNNGYKKGLEIERIDNDGNYEPSNCRWATRQEQMNNRRNTIYITYNGETDTLANLCRKYGIKYYIVRGRLAKGWNIEDAFSVKVKGIWRYNLCKNAS